jgi:hypothetical protein
VCVLCNAFSLVTWLYFGMYLIVMIVAILFVVEYVFRVPSYSRLSHAGRVNVIGAGVICVLCVV